MAKQANEFTHLRSMMRETAVKCTAGAEGETAPRYQGLGPLAPITTGGQYLGLLEHKVGTNIFIYDLLAFCTKKRKQ